jgi:hypothetical protein
MWFTSFLQRTSCQVVSGDTMMHRAWGPVWHTKQKAPRILPARLRGVAQEAKRLWWETGHLRGVVETVIMDSKTDDDALFAEFQRQRGITLLTTPPATRCFLVPAEGERDPTIAGLRQP